MLWIYMVSEKNQWVKQMLQLCATKTEALECIVKEIILLCESRKKLLRKNGRENWCSEWKGCNTEYIHTMH